MANKRIKKKQATMKAKSLYASRKAYNESRRKTDYTTSVITSATAPQVNSANTNNVELIKSVNKILDDIAHDIRYYEPLRFDNVSEYELYRAYRQLQTGYNASLRPYIRRAQELLEYKEALYQILDDDRMLSGARTLDMFMKRLCNDIPSMLRKYTAKRKGNQVEFLAVYYDGLGHETGDLWDD